MVYTGVLDKDATKEQIKSAPKTVQIITEVNGHKYVELFQGTELVALVLDDDLIEGKILASPGVLAEMVESFMDRLPEELVMYLFSKRIAAGSKFNFN